ncbi:hypothetical protein R50072_03070 [Simiduia litorea]|uniref:DUF5992 family protein n=1 Tax=Halorubrum tibetense TaxID=175631 RepID=A0ABD5SII4_9EURY
MSGIKLITLISLALLSFAAVAGGRTNAAIPSKIDLVQAGTAGFMIFGDFGNVGSCTVSDQVFVKASHPQYSQIYSTVLAAFMSGKKVSGYAHLCEPVAWYSTPSITYNVLTEAGSISVEH